MLLSIFNTFKLQTRKLIFRLSIGSQIYYETILRVFCKYYVFQIFPKFKKFNFEIMTVRSLNKLSQVYLSKKLRNYWKTYSSDTIQYSFLFSWRIFILVKSIFYTDTFYWLVLLNFFNSLGYFNLNFSKIPERITSYTSRR